MIILFRKDIRIDYFITKALLGGLFLFCLRAHRVTPESFDSACYVVALVCVSGRLTPHSAIRFRQIGPAEQMAVDLNSKSWC